MCCKRYHIIFSTFSLKFKCKICVQKEVIHNFKNHILVTWPATNLIILRKWCGFEKTKSLLFCLRCDPLIVFRKKNHITFIFIEIDVTWPFSAKWPVCVLSVLIAIIPTHLLCQMQANLPEVEFWTISKFRNRNKISSLLVYVLHKTRI